MKQIAGKAKICDLLSQREMTFTELRKEMRISKVKLSQHLSWLAAAGLVASTRDVNDARVKIFRLTVRASDDAKFANFAHKVSREVFKPFDAKLRTPEFWEKGFNDSLLAMRQEAQKSFTPAELHDFLTKLGAAILFAEIKLAAEEKESDLPPPPPSFKNLQKFHKNEEIKAANLRRLRRGFFANIDTAPLMLVSLLGPEMLASKLAEIKIDNEDLKKWLTEIYDKIPEAQAVQAQASEEPHRTRAKRTRGA
jgi:DNA-binding MarR family transcriptional regulator